MPLIPDRSKQRCIITGLIVNSLVMGHKCFSSIGVHCESRENSGITGASTSLLEWQVSLPAAPERVRKSLWPEDTRVTTANLTQIKQLKVQKRPVVDGKPEAGLRYAGLLIHHTDESIETLGRWDGSSIAPSEMVYDSETDGQLLRLVFILTFRPIYIDDLKNFANISYYMSNIVAHTSRLRGQQGVQELQEVQEQTELEQLEQLEHGEPEEEDEWFPKIVFDWDIDKRQLVSVPFRRKIEYV